MTLDARLVTCEALPDGDPETRRLAGLLTDEALEVEISAWSDPAVDWTDARLTLIRSARDYHRDRAGFLDWAARAARVTDLQNVEPLVVWNSHKSYLMVMRGMGVPVVPTVLLSSTSLAEARSRGTELGWDETVLKPAVGGDAEGVRRLRPDGDDDQGPLPGDWMLQPFVESVTTGGELSVMFFDGEPSHSVRRRPARGDFRAESRHGGRVRLEDTVPTRWMDAARAAVDFARPRPLYARVDLVEWEGLPHVMELDLIEPVLFLEEHPPAAARFVKAVGRRIRRA